MLPHTPSPSGTTHWRVFPWNRRAAPGEPFSPRSVAPRHKQGGGRFDLPERTSVLYLAESPEHAYAELLRQFPAQLLRRAHLRACGLPLAAVEVTLPADVSAALPDLGDPAELLRFGLRPDLLALPGTVRAETQAASRALHDAGVPGFRWWSALHGAWHTTVLFVDRVPLERLRFGRPRAARLADPTVRAGAAAARMRLPAARPRAAPVP